MGPNFLKFSKDVHVNSTRPFFFLNNKKVIYIFDPPHILKATRNMFFQHNFQYKDELIEQNI